MQNFWLHCKTELMKALYLKESKMNKNDEAKYKLAQCAFFPSQNLKFAILVNLNEKKSFCQHKL